MREVFQKGIKNSPLKMRWLFTKASVVAKINLYFFDATIITFYF